MLLDDMPCKSCIVEAGVENSSRNPVLLPISTLIEILKARSGNDPVNALASMAAKVQSLAINFIDDQICRRDWQFAMNTEVCV